MACRTSTDVTSPSSEFTRYLPGHAHGHGARPVRRRGQRIVTARSARILGGTICGGDRTGLLCCLSRCSSSCTCAIAANGLYTSCKPCISVCSPGRKATKPLLWCTGDVAERVESIAARFTSSRRSLAQPSSAQVVSYPPASCAFCPLSIVPNLAGLSVRIAAPGRSALAARPRPKSVRPKMGACFSAGKPATGYGGALSTMLLARVTSVSRVLTSAGPACATRVGLIRSHTRRLRAATVVLRRRPHQLHAERLHAADRRQARLCN